MPRKKRKSRATSAPTNSAPPNIAPPNIDSQALEYHSHGKPGKVDVRSHKKCDTEYDLSLAYSPGVAAPCLKIAKTPLDAYKYTTKGNLVAVVSNGSAVLGLGNIGPLASKPVMEGKGVLFKQFAGIDVFDIELKTSSIDNFVQAVKSLEPTFGGINLEDIKAPDCFEIEKQLKEQLNIPVFHDDQHGTAIITLAALINACSITKRKLSSIKVVFNGAGASAIACAKLMISQGVKKKNLIMCDSRGVIRSQRTDLNKYKKEFARDLPHRTLQHALKGADVFCGLSVADCLTPAMLKHMAAQPIVFALANPDPEINPQLAKQTRPDVIMATGRSDFPNQVNNVLGFPSIFRGALDVRATDITEKMKLAAAHALASLARADVPDSVSKAYNDEMFRFGPEYIIPKPFDPRVLMNVAPAVAKAAHESGVAQEPIKNFKSYREKLEALGSTRRGIIRSVMNRIQSFNKKAKQLPLVMFPEGRSPKILKALATIKEENIIRPLLLGYEQDIRARIKELEIENLDDLQIVHPLQHPEYRAMVDKFYKLRHRKGVMYAEAERLLANPYYFSAQCVREGLADSLVSGSTQNYADCLKPLLQIIEPQSKGVVAGVNIVTLDKKMIFFTDTTVNIEPSAEDLARMACQVAQLAKFFDVQPRIAALSFSNFTARQASPSKMQQAVQLIRKMEPSLIVDGEMQADTAVNPQILADIFPFSRLKQGANILLFPNLDSGNIAYKLVQQLSEAQVLGPFIVGLQKPVNVLQRTCTVDDIVNTVAVTALLAQTKQ